MPQKIIADPSEVTKVIADPSEVTAAPQASIRGVGKLEHYGNLAAEALPDVGGAMGALVGGTLGESIFPFGGGLGGALAGSQIGGSLGRGAEGSLKSIVSRMAGVPSPPEPSWRKAERQEAVFRGVLDVANAGAKQQYQTLAAEGLGRGVKGGMEALFPKANIPAGRVAGEVVPGKAVGKLAEEGMISGPEAAKRTTIQRFTDYSILGNRIAAKAKQQGTEVAAQYADDMASRIAPASDPRTSGMQLRTALEQARTNYRQLGKQYWERDLPAAGANITVDMTPLIKDAEDASSSIPETLLRQSQAKLPGGASFNMEQLPSAVQQALQAAGQGGAALPQESGASQLIKNLQALKPQMSAQDALQVKKYIDQFLPEGAFATNETQGLAKRFSGTFYNQMEDAAAKQGGPFADTWKRARNFWGKGQETFDSTLVKNILEKDPEGYVKMLHDGDVTDINQVKQALFGQVERTPQPGLRGQAQGAWDAFRRQYIQSRLLQDPENIGNTLANLKARMNKVGPDQLAAVFNTDAKGREVLGNLRTLAETMSRQNKVGAGPHPLLRLTELGSVAGIFAGHPESMVYPITVEGLLPALAKVMYSKRMTQQMVRGLELSNKGLPQGAQIISRLISSAAREGQDKYGSTPEMPQPEATQ